MKRSIRRVSELLLLAGVALMAAHGFADDKQKAASQRPRPASTGGGKSWSIVTSQPTYGGYGGYGNGWGGGGGGGTVAGNYMQGMASAVRAAGDYNLETSQAYVNAEEGKRREIENRKQWTDAYFEMRRANAEYRSAERGPKGTSDDWVRYAKEAAPSRLSPGEIDYVSGRIAWPRLLQADEFKDRRQELEHLFELRADKGGSIGPNGYQKIQDTADAMTAYLKKNIKRYPPNEYIDAKKFLESLAYEARFTTG